MANQDQLLSALSKIMNAEKDGNRECYVPKSNLIKDAIDIMNDNDYIGDYEVIEDGKGGKLKVNLIGNINDCSSIKPRFNAEVDEIEKWERRYLPARGFGILLISTSEGVLTHDEAKEEEVGGKLLAYCY